MINAVLRGLGTWQWCKRRETVNFPVGNYMQTNSCFMQWPWTFGVSLWWKIKRLTPALHHKLWGYNTHTPRITARTQDYVFLFQTKMFCYSPSQISWSNIEQRVKDHILPSQYHSMVAHRSKTQPELFPNYSKLLFERWRSRGIEVVLSEDLALL